MSHALVKNIREIRHLSTYKEVARENRHLRARLSDMVDLCDSWYYGPLWPLYARFNISEPLTLRRAKGALAGDFRRVFWAKHAAIASVTINRRLRKTPMKIRHLAAGLWVFLLGWLAMVFGHATGWWAPDDTFGIILAAFGGFMAGGASMWERVVSRHFGQMQ